MEIALALLWRFGPALAAPEEARLLALLEGVARHGSIAAAARELGMSYRHAWGCIEKWQAVFGHALLDATRGSGSLLSPFAQRLIEVDARLRKRLGARLAAACDEMHRELAAEDAPSQTRLSIVASHDLALIRLRELMSADGHEVDLRFRGSVESLAALAQGGCDAAGFHCPEGELGQRMWPHYQRYLSPRKHAVLRLCRRVQGLIVPPGNPKRLRSVADLARRNVRFLNRQQGAGTRLLLDLLLQDEGIEPQRIRGYASEEYTHAAVAALVAGGEADAALGIEAAARRFGLDFVPLVAEHYYLAVHRGRLREPHLMALRSHAASEAFRAAVASLGGYDAGQSGEQLEIVPAAAPAVGAKQTKPPGQRRVRSKLT